MEICAIELEVKRFVGDCSGRNPENIILVHKAWAKKRTGELGAPRNPNVRDHVMQNEIHELEGSIPPRIVDFTRDILGICLCCLCVWWWNYKPSDVGDLLDDVYGD